MLLKIPFDRTGPTEFGLPPIFVNPCLLLIFLLIFVFFLQTDGRGEKVKLLS